MIFSSLQLHNRRRKNASKYWIKCWNQIESFSDFDSEFECPAILFDTIIDIWYNRAYRSMQFLTPVALPSRFNLYIRRFSISPQCHTFNVIQSFGVFWKDLYRKIRIVASTPFRTENIFAPQHDSSLQSQLSQQMFCKFLVTIKLPPTKQ